jgi:single-strand DNA-binding protein
MQFAHGHEPQVEGRLQSRSWETDKGEKRSILEVVAERVQFLSSGRRDGASGSSAGGADFEAGGPPPSPEPQGGSDDDIPF